MLLKQTMGTTRLPKNKLLYTLAESVAYSITKREVFIAFHANLLIK